MLKQDSFRMRAKDLHELLRAWENYHRILTAEAHMHPGREARFGASGEHASQWAAIESIAGKIGCTAETLRHWIRRARA